jgi:hypothetical protein
MNGEPRGVILYGYGADAVAEALHELDPRYIPVDDEAPELGQVPVLRRPDGAEADDARSAASGVAWLVVELYRPEDELERAHDPVLWLNTSKVDPRTAARAIDQTDLVIWYEVIDPIRADTVDGGPTADDYSNIAIIVPDGHRMVAHAVSGGTAPECLPSAAEQVLRSNDLWALAPLQEIEICQACALRHG